MWVLENKDVRIAVDARARLRELVHKSSGHNYAGGGALWRLYVQEGERLDIEIDPAAGPDPEIFRQADTLVIRYGGLQSLNRPVDVDLTLRLRLEGGEVHAGAEVRNREPGLTVREVHFPLVGSLRLRAGQELLWSHLGGERIHRLQDELARRHTQYMGMDHRFVGMDIAYPGWAATNCFSFAGPDQGLYLGCHDPSFEHTGHQIRSYGGEMEAGFVRYPHLRCGESAALDAFVIMPYLGAWHRAADRYRAWAESWYKAAVPPGWVRQMKGWQRIILKHQYGDIHYRYDDLPAILADGLSGGIDALHLFGWWAGGMDNRNPEYVPDEDLGGEEALRRGIADFRAGGGNVILYASGRLIDVTTGFYRATGRAISIKDRLGVEVRDAYRFRGPGTFAAQFGARTFVAACPSSEAWFQQLRAVADRAMDLGCRAIFYDQVGLTEYPCCDATHGHPVPFMGIAASKARLAQRLRQYVKSKHPDMALGVEHISDCLAPHTDFVHSVLGYCNPPDDPAPVKSWFIDWFRYLFPEVILTDREIRDDTDIARRVNHCLLKGLRSDVEIYRCRRTLSSAPHYQAYLAKANRLRDDHAELLLAGTYRDTLGFTVDAPEVEARAFCSGDRMAILLTQNRADTLATGVTAPGFRYGAHDGIGAYDVGQRDGRVQVRLSRDALVFLEFGRQQGQAVTT